MFDAIHKHIRLASTLNEANTIFLMWLSAKYPTVPLLDGFVPDGLAELTELRRVFLSWENLACGRSAPFSMSYETYKKQVQGRSKPRPKSTAVFSL